MPTHMDAADLAVSGDTTPTAIGSITVAAGVQTRIIGIWAYAIAGAVLTTAEAATGILELDSKSGSVKPFVIPLAVVSMLTGGSVAYEPRIIPVEDFPVTGGQVITATVTMDMAQTGGFKVRWGVIYAPY